MTKSEWINHARIEEVDGKNIITDWNFYSDEIEKYKDLIREQSDLSFSDFWQNDLFPENINLFYIPSQIGDKIISGARIGSYFKTILIDCELEKLELESSDNGLKLKNIIFGPNFKMSNDKFVDLVKSIEEKTYEVGFPKIFKFFESESWWRNKKLVPRENYDDIVPILGKEWIGVTVQFDKRGNERRRYKTLDKNITLGTIVTADYGEYYAEGTVCDIEPKFNKTFYCRKPINTVIEYKKNESIKELVDYISVKELCDDIIKIRKKGNSKKFKNLELPSFEGKKVIISEGAFKGCKIGTIVFNCNVIKVEKDAFQNCDIKRFKKLQNLKFENIEDETLKFLISSEEISKFNDKPKDYLKRQDLKAIVALCNHIITEEQKFRLSINEFDWKLGYITSSLVEYGLFNEFSNDLKILALEYTFNDYDDSTVQEYIKDNYYDLLLRRNHNIIRILVKDKFYQSWAKLDNAMIVHLFNEHLSTDFFSEISDKLVNDLYKILMRCKENKDKSFEVYENMLKFYYNVKFYNEKFGYVKCDGFFCSVESLSMMWNDIDKIIFADLLEYSIVNDDPKLSQLSNFEVSEEIALKISNRINEEYVDIINCAVRNDGFLYDYQLDDAKELYYLLNGITIKDGESKEFIKAKEKAIEEFNNICKLDITQNIVAKKQVGK